MARNSKAEVAEQADLEIDENHAEPRGLHEARVPARDVERLQLLAGIRRSR